MPPTNTNTKKRPAPGSSPTMQGAQLPPTCSAPAQKQMSNSEYPRYNQTPENAIFQDPSMYNLSTYGSNVAPQGQYDLSSQVQSNPLQLARRPINHQLVPTGQRFDNTADPWGQFADDSMPDGQDGNNRLSEADNIELLEEKAAVAKRDAQSKRKQIPPFVQKLSSFLDGAKNTDLIRWSDRGDSFVVLDEDEFAKTLIPELFKHNNYASFVRQLNMYGFHKRVGLSDNSMKASERKNKSPSEYYNPYFKRGHPNLLWLINKPKGGTSKGNKGNKKPKEELDVDSDDDGRDGVEEIYRDTMPGNSRAISQAPEAGPLQTRELAVVQHQLAEIQKQQGAITNALTRLRKDHTQLFQQSLNFQNLHDRHENSINAILTFLATVYNRSLDGNSPQNFAQMFANGIPHDQHNQGNVVELGEPARVPQTPANMSSQRRHQRLLMAPPSKGRVETPSLAATPQAQNYPTSRSGTVEELFDASPPDTSDVKTEQDQQQQQQPDMMLNIINSTNAQNGANASAMEFPEMLSHYENANGQSPLTSEQRNTVLNMIANSSSAPGTNNALVSPTPPEPPNMDDIEYASADIDRLLQAHSANGDRLNNVLQPPLDPPGNVPPIDYNSFLNGLDTNDAMNNNLDLDQYLNTGAFYNGNDQTTSDFNFDDFGDTTGVGDSHFDLGMDGTNDGGRPNDNGNSSNSGMLDNDMDDATGNPMRSPSKKRRRK